MAVPLVLVTLGTTYLRLTMTRFVIFELNRTSKAMATRVQCVLCHRPTGNVSCRLQLLATPAEDRFFVRTVTTSSKIFF